MSVNKAVLIGRLGADPEVRYTREGKAVANFSLATQRGRDAPTHWHRVVAWGERAEFCERNLAKGRQVYVEGEITYRQWDDRDGERRTSTEIVAWSIEALDARPQERGSSREDQRGPTSGYEIPF